jgi:hypothetical protein
MTGATRPSVAAALVFFAAFFLLFSSGRVASMDAGQQLQVSLMAALTGAMSDAAGSGPAAQGGWVRGPNGRYYQAHDIGNVLLMMPAAWLGARMSHAEPGAAILDPPPASRVGAALTCSFLAALGCWWLFRLFLLFLPGRAAFILALLFPCTTIFFAYARSAWDVLGGCCCVCGVLFYAARYLRGVAPGPSLVLAAVMLALAGSFRFSLVPFLSPALAALALWRPRLASRGALIGALLVFLLLLAPSLAYNQRRTGSMLRPATAAPQYLAGANALTGNVIHGVAGLLLSPNRGLFVFCPVLLFAAAAPLREYPELRPLLGAFGVGACAYALLIATMANWGAFGWGPRYLLPVLPVLYVPAAFGLLRACRQSRRATLAAVAVCVLLTLPGAVVNWHLATVTTAGAARADVWFPEQQYVAWKALAAGLRGESLPVPAGVVDPLRATTAAFPDLFLVRLARQSAPGLAAGVLTALSALVALAWSFSVLMRHEAPLTSPMVRAHG